MAVTESRPGYRAKTKFIIASPYKIRPVAALIRHKLYPDAMALLENMPHRGARLVRKTLKSAASNALNLNKQLDEDMLYVREVLVDEGPRLKRIWYRARGRADMLLKRLSHITVVIDETSRASAARGKAGE
ncbi:MAG: 50S ribosomal protein L22 [Spirochaetaceae bacterium]|jgi:large subunit ribosomal protein L22|nr:50S ribosomal protein L22 [Spirochaetaceae bacterium]